MELEVTISTEDFSGAIEERSERIIAGLRQEMQVQTLGALSYIKDAKLSGQVLNQRTGNLKNSGFTSVSETPTQLTGEVGFGKTVPYARIHNYGGQINVPEVTGKLMVFERAGEAVFTYRHRAFTVNMPERNYLESGLTEREAIILEAFRARMAKEAAGGSIS